MCRLCAMYLHTFEICGNFREPLVLSLAKRSSKLRKAESRSKRMRDKWLGPALGRDIPVTGYTDEICDPVNVVTLTLFGVIGIRPAGDAEARDT
ncbi:hypothetical protein LOZ12_006671 [Ophidiomyces ophidiicola]|nr:hypothetical protein LOZ62_006680 [Ophidiomyces ophidiicola]KAI1947758.1 hypothetical protein LOZ59_006537 [Ophidiomyces ophidiicola]KAI2108050.1 hypothetical protein LOZ42_006061 [Ophidiomyces ophidiicola]KAI2186362.1 hypothetical protein LOZ20_006623 [Ophidiomyces ophidiicola]KAI2195368.1 hypothetical protein LOZ18_005790 [Ophidiomyces ophidiicola]